MYILYSVDDIQLNGARPANRRRSLSVGLILGQRRGRWLSIKPTLAQCLMPAAEKYLLAQDMFTFRCGF